MEHIERNAQKSNATLAICITALFMALNIMMSSFGLPVPGAIYISMMLSSARQQFCWITPRLPSSSAALVPSWAIYSSTRHRCSFLWLLTAFRLLSSASWHTAAAR